MVSTPFAFCKRSEKRGTLGGLRNASLFFLYTVRSTLCGFTVCAYFQKSIPHVNWEKRCTFSFLALIVILLTWMQTENQIKDYYMGKQQLGAWTDNKEWMQLKLNHKYMYTWDHATKIAHYDTNNISKHQLGVRYLVHLVEQWPLLTTTLLHYLKTFCYLTTELFR